MLGHNQATVRCDNEPSITLIQDQVIAQRSAEGKKTVPELTPKHSSASNGYAERGIQGVRNQAKTLRVDLEQKYGVKIDASMPVWSWLQRHAAWLQSKICSSLNHQDQL